MDNDNFRVSGEAGVAIPAGHADKLLELCDGTCALLYLYAQRMGGGFSRKAAANALRRTEAEISKAVGILQSHGLVAPGIRPQLPAPADEMPEYTAEDIAERSKEKGDFPAVVTEAQRILGKTLSGADLKTLFGIYDYLRLPAEVMVLLINHCVELARERSGPGRLPSMRTIEKEAYVWFNREILTLEQAEDYLKAKRNRADALSEIKHILQINGRGFSATEREYVESWLESGFDAEAIAIAYDRTVVKTGSLQWRYMNSILTSWHAKGLHSTEEITRGDKRETGVPKPAEKEAEWDDAEHLRKKYEKLGNR